MLALALAPACSEDKEEPPPAPAGPVEEPPPPTGSVEVTVEYPSTRDESGIAVVQMWVLVPDDSGEVTCARLIGGDVEPHDLSVVQHGEARVTDTGATLTDDSVEVGTGLIYVEATDFLGNVHLAGCVEGVEVAEGGTASEHVPLQTARVYDCADSETEDGAPCDDGDFCTVGETCDNGECETGAQRDCSHLTDECNAGTCEEPLGCERVPYPDGRSCEDGLYCTDGDVCQGGQCQGNQVDCNALAGMCQVALVCDEAYGGCVIEDAPYGDPCDDGEFCTDNDYCDGYGTCYGGGLTDCSVLNDQCNTGYCDEVADQCDVIVNEGASCVDALSCTVLSACDATGACVGTSTVNCASSNVDDCNVGRCVEASMGCETVYAPLDTPCADNACLIGSLCDGAGNCTGGTPISCSGPCDTGTCNPVTGCDRIPTGGLCRGLEHDCTQSCNSLGQCVMVNATSTTPCDDLNPCTSHSECLSGSCNYDVSYVLPGEVCPDAPDDCTQRCNGAGLCEPVQASDGVACDDGDPCTQSAMCATGACARALVVPPGNLCRDALDDCTRTCDGSAACVATPAVDTTTCDDGNPGTVSDQCVSQVCTGF